MLDPCFGPDTNSVLVTDPQTIRIKQLNYLEADTLLPFLPESLSVDGYADMAPFLTADGGSLYFSSNRPGGYGGLDIWVTRQSDGVWQMPFNLGPNINSEIDESGPSLTADGTELFFCSATNGDIGTLKKSTLIDNQWAPTEPLLAPIHSQYGEREPSISADGQYLYFISYITNNYESSAWVSRRDGDSWSQPVPLTGFINLIWEVCAFMPEGYPLSVSIDQSSRRLVYTKQEVYECIDPEYRVYMSYLSTGTDESRGALPQSISISLYPNPFNSSLAISIDGTISEIAIYDLLGKRIRSFSNVAPNIVIWDGRSDDGTSCASGIYFVKASSGDHSLVRSATMLK
jgi:hypothetical protein